MLGGINYQPRSLNGALVFTKDPPSAVSHRSYNRSEALTQTRVAYGAGMSEWCLNCHTDYDSKKSHPAGNAIKITPQMATLYNSYLPEDNGSNSYLSLTPFEVGSTDYSRLKKLAVNDDSQLGGPVNANVSCLSCHRAHASGWYRGLRFNLETRLTTVADSSGKVAYPDPSNHQAYAQGRTIAETRKAYYDREATKFGAQKRNLCSKCHAKE
jgi:cytochrome c2